MKGIVLGLAAGLLAGNAYGVTIAIIDSGTDIEHKDFTNRIWINPAETIDNSADDESNGYVDDINGWNFAANNNQVIDYKDESTYNEDVKKFFEIQSKIVKNEATDEEIQWTKDKVADQTFVQNLQKFGNYAHGTHVTGIALGEQDVNTVALKLIGNPSVKEAMKRIARNLEGETTEEEQEGDKEGEIGPVKDKVIRAGIDYIVKQQGKAMDAIGKYVAFTKADVANGSFGTGMVQAQMIVKAILGVAGVKNPTDEQLKEYSIYFVEQVTESMKGLVVNAPDTLFVFAAGNDGSNNDDLPVAPANIDASNKITVAATIENNMLAKFSNFGFKKVDIAAPGVAIDSAIPKDKHLMMNGTSQASPAVAHIAAAVKAANPALKPEQIKEILMGTVDKKDWLSDKVVSGGVANKARAVEAAAQAASKPVAEAIAAARQSVADQPTAFAFVSESLDALFALPLPSTITAD